jgi:ribosome-associated heat shock protein Hsp15
LIPGQNKNSIRIDKWLWAARFFKTRSLATSACEHGKVEARGQQVKPSRDVKIGDMLRVKNDSGDFTIEVLGLSDIRGPAPVAQALYRETDESKLARQRFIEQRKTMPFFEALAEGKPSKRDRRRFDRLRGRP